MIDAQALVWNHQILVKLHLISQTEAVRARTKWVVEREAARLNLIHADTAVRAGKILAERQGIVLFFAVFIPHRRIGQHQTIGETHDCFNRIRKAFLNPRLDHQAIDHNLNIVLNIFIQRDLLGKLV